MLSIGFMINQIDIFFRCSSCRRIVWACQVRHVECFNYRRCTADCKIGCIRINRQLWPGLFDLRVVISHCQVAKKSWSWRCLPVEKCQKVNWIVAAVAGDATEIELKTKSEAGPSQESCWKGNARMASHWAANQKWSMGARVSEIKSKSMANKFKKIICLIKMGIP